MGFIKASPIGFYAADNRCMANIGNPNRQINKSQRLEIKWTQARGAIKSG